MLGALKINKLGAGSPFQLKIKGKEMKHKKIKGIIFPKIQQDLFEKNKRNTTLRRKYCQATPQKICLQLKCRFCGYSINNSKLFNNRYISELKTHNG